MDIRSLKNDAFINRKQNREIDSKFSSRSQSVDSAGPKGINDILDVSKANQNDISVAKTAYQKLDEGSLANLREVKSKISSGFYQQDNVFDKVSQSVLNEVQTLEAETLSFDSKQLSQEELKDIREKLVNNVSIISEIADRLSKTLTNL